MITCAQWNTHSREKVTRPRGPQAIRTFSSILIRLFFSLVLLDVSMVYIEHTNDLH